MTRLPWLALGLVACGPTVQTGATTGSSTGRLFFGSSNGGAGSGSSTGGTTNRSSAAHASGGTSSGTSSGGSSGGNSSGGASTGATSIGGSSTTGGAASGIAFVDGGVTLQVPVTAGSIAIGFDISLMASGANGLAAALTNGVGTLTPPSGNALPAFIYERQPWPQYDYTLYQTLAVGPTDWHIGWFYCADAGPTYVDYEATDNAQLQTLPVSGSCDETAATIDEQVSLPASTLQLQGLVQGFSVSGPDLTLSGSQLGTMSIDGAPWSVFPFALVDCSTQCGTPGWYELHSIYWDAADTRTCFGIFYLTVGSPSSVQLDYSLCLPDLGDPTNGGVSFTSSWTGP